MLEYLDLLTDLVDSCDEIFYGCFLGTHLLLGLFDQLLLSLHSGNDDPLTDKERDKETRREEQEESCDDRAGSMQERKLFRGLPDTFPEENDAYRTDECIRDRMTT
jgi:hypothetical protein